MEHACAQMAKVFQEIFRMASAAPERGQWSNKIEVLLSYIGYCVGLGNIYRFPYLCYRNGGGAFLIPYFLVLVLTGLPVYYMEIMLGQYSACGASTVWKFAPLFKGIGYTMMITCTLFCLYYNQIMAYVLHFLFSSFRSSLPWSTCDNSWNTPFCKSFSNENNTHTYENTTKFYLLQSAPLALNTTMNATLNITTNITKDMFKSPAEEYWRRYVLNISDGIEDMGGFEWKLVLLLLLSWIITFLCLVKGIQSTGKVVYFTATFPYVVLLILLIRGITLPGAIIGLKYYLIPDFKKLANTRVWGDAASQVFFSLGQSWGILITYGSYNKFNHRSERDAVIAVFACALTSLFAGLVVFSVIGFLSYEMGQPIEKVMNSGPGLVFVVYPEALSRMPVAPLWSILFFFMLFTIGVDSQFTTLECMLSGLTDEFPQILRNRKTLFNLVCCIILFLLCLPLSMQGGMYVLSIFDWYSSTFPPLIVSMFEAIIISYVYGLRRFTSDIELMTGSKPNWFWKICWAAVTPTIVLGITIFQIIYFSPVTYNKYTFPWWAELIGWSLCALSILAIPVWMIIKIVQKYPSCGSLGSTLKLLLRPEPTWGPQEKNPALYHEDEIKYLNGNEMDVIKT